MNKQPITKPVLYTSTDQRIAVHSIFPTIQGEGPYAGQPAIFVRLWGCNLQCPQCDTDYTSNVEYLTPLQLVQAIDEATEGGKPSLVVFTGGEPLRQPIGGAVMRLLTGDGTAQHWTVQIETNGTVFPHDGGIGYLEYCTVVCSPKTGTVNSKLLPLISAYKYVLHTDHTAPDGLPTQVLGLVSPKRVARPHDGFKGPVYVQPVDEHDEQKNTRHLINATVNCVTHGYTLCLQLHKIIGID